MNRTYSLLIAAAAFCATQTWAVPRFQLDIAGGTYDSGTDTIMAPGNPFTLQALIEDKAGDSTDGIQPDTRYYISAAIVAPAGSSTAAFGSFSIDGTSYTLASSAVEYGTPPTEDMTFNPDDIGSHGIFPTYYAEIEFIPDANKRATLYNSANNPGGLVPNATGESIYEDFLVDISGLTTFYSVHFDFYSVKVVNKGGKKSREVGTKIDLVAPFSKDAQSLPAGNNVPDGGATAVLLGFGFLGMSLMRRRN